MGTKPGVHHCCGMARALTAETAEWSLHQQESLKWRRGGDSNPRDPFGPNGFQDRRIQPLSHPSASQFNRQSPRLPTTKTGAPAQAYISGNHKCVINTVAFSIVARLALVLAEGARHPPTYRNFLEASFSKHQPETCRQQEIVLLDPS